ncbi:MAG: hypothetical protein HYT80_02765 [Euryarchaeota archaeon]|nr:hypothetical protein [Euryarchaeota archaeon]
MRRTLALSAVVVGLLIPGVVAHPAAPPVEYATRLLHDCNDDWGGHSTVNDGHDTIALDLYEAHNATLDADVIVFKLVLNGGYNGDATRPALEDVVTFKVGEQSVTRKFRTVDNVAFTGDFDAVAGPKAFNTAAGAADGARFYLEGIVRLSTIGASVGSTISAAAVQGYAGSTKADHMPGGYTSGGQTVQDCSTIATEQASPARYPVSGTIQYKVKGPVQYASLASDVSSVTVAEDGNATVTLTIKNLLKQAQKATLRATPSAGIAFHAASYRTGETTIDLEAEAQKTVHMYVTPATGAKDGPVTLRLTTNLGGSVLVTIQVNVDEAPAPTTTASTVSPKAESGGLPGPMVPAALFALAAAAAATTRRRG